MTTWIIRPSYKFDLANLCNLMTGDEVYSERHPEAHAYFSPRFEPAILAQARAAFQQGILLGPGISSLLSMSDYHGPDIDLILDGLELAAANPFFAPYAVHFPLIRSLLRHVHELGAYDYWRTNCLPSLERKCEELLADAGKYPVVETASAMLGDGHVSTGTTIQLFIGHFAAPHATSLHNLAYLSDLRWGLEMHVAIAVHELLHPPFEREEIKKLSEQFWSDAFFQEAKARLPLSSGYPRPEDFLEENLVEAAHVYLAEQLGVLDSPLEYFVTHDSGTHIVSPIVYSALRQGVRDRCGSLKDAIQLMIDEGMLTPGKLREQYCRIYKQAGLEHPYLC